VGFVLSQVVGGLVAWIGQALIEEFGGEIR
jgi:hypothetical protein